MFGFGYDGNNVIIKALPKPCRLSPKAPRFIVIQRSLLSGGVAKRRKPTLHSGFLDEPARPRHARPKRYIEIDAGET